MSLEGVSSSISTSDNCIMTSTISYTSDKANNNGNQKLNTTYKTDILEITGDPDEETVCDVYTNKRNKMIELQKKSYKFAVSRYDEMTQIMSDYYSGKVSQQEVIDSFQGYCQEYFDFRTENGIVEGNDKDKKDAIMYIYECFQERSSSSAVNVCKQKADEIAENYGYTGVGNRDFVYYDADIYYSCEDMRSKLIEATEIVMDNWGLENVDVDSEIEYTEKNTRFSNGGITFNGIWSDAYAKNSINRCNMIDINEVPPEGFSLFYKESNDSSISDSNGNITLESQKGVLIIDGNELCYKTDLSFNNSLILGGLSEFYNVGNLLFNSKISDIGIMDFAKNFNVYTRLYDYKNYEY